MAFDPVLLLYAWAGAQIAVLPIELPMLYFILQVKTQTARLTALGEMVPELSYDQRRILKVRMEKYTADEIARYYAEKEMASEARVERESR